ncbi:hypothetical protein [Embleya sp. NBC_00896]|uniref:hypothetical protein n=1 Tax=Embleya sp. NBC_00896 TaxID=2975961 RepID=UPI002F919413|nr:hypothetical protein OG928_46115 [Embleya sp. NBC_00896]
MGFHADSETGRLKQVILHHPDLERPTTTNKDDLRFPVGQESPRGIRRVRRPEEANRAEAEAHRAA